jgi:hypothetical protein
MGTEAITKRVVEGVGEAERVVPEGEPGNRPEREPGNCLARPDEERPPRRREGVVSDPDY